MINHASIGVRDITRSKRFYDAALAPLGYRCLSEGEGSHGRPGLRPEYAACCAAFVVDPDGYRLEAYCGR